MSSPTLKSTGRVCLVGAGPGDPGLLTITGLARLRAADVVVFDALANPILLQEAPPQAKLIDCGKRAKNHKLTQDETNQLLVDEARHGGLVVRLKGGDPYLFGRGAEEAAFVAKHGIAVEVVPGITAGLAAPATAGIPVTHRKLASTVTIVTGHEDPTKAGTAVDYEGLTRLIRAGGTACFYMGVGRLAEISATLIGCGLDSATPAAVVQWGTLPSQRTARGTLTSIATEVERQGVSSPAIIVVGAVAGLNEPGLDYFTNRPLFGQRILVTRTRQQASALREQLEMLGADVIEAATIELVPPPDWAAVDAAVRTLGLCDWLMLTSVNAVRVFAERLNACGMDSRVLASVRIAAVGEATEAAVWEYLRLRADFVPTTFAGEALAAELLARQSLKGKRCLLLRADIARPGLPAKLREAGALVEEIVAYETRVPDALDPAAAAAIADGKLDWVTFTSSSTARNLVQLLGGDVASLKQCKIASIGPVTSQTLSDLGLPPTVEAPEARLESLVAAIADTR